MITEQYELLDIYIESADVSTAPHVLFRFYDTPGSVQSEAKNKIGRRNPNHLFSKKNLEWRLWYFPLFDKKIILQGLVRAKCQTMPQVVAPAL
jgi:hypothetical protein